MSCVASQSGGYNTTVQVQVFTLRCIKTEGQSPESIQTKLVGKKKIKQAKFDSVVVFFPLCSAQLSSAENPTPPLPSFSLSLLEPMECGDVNLVCTTIPQHTICSVHSCVADPELPGVLYVTNGPGFALVRFADFVSRLRPGRFIQCLFADWRPTQRVALGRAAFTLQAAGRDGQSHTALLAHYCPPNDAFQEWAWQLTHPTLFRHFTCLALLWQVAGITDTVWGELTPVAFRSWVLRTIDESSYSAV